jgi:signal transduction histidine kinase
VAATTGTVERAGLDPHPARRFHLLIVVPGLALIGTLFLLAPPAGGHDLAGWVFWTLLIGLVELLPVPAWRTLQVSMAFPLATAVAILYPPGIAGVILLLGSSDPREFRSDVPFLRAIFNRTQAALATVAASVIFHALGGELGSWRSLAAAAPPAVLADYLTNTTLVSVSVSRIHGIPVRAVLREMRIGAPYEFLISYISLGFLGIVLARFFVDVGWWAVAAFAMPLLLARQAFFRTHALEQATSELRGQQALLQNLSNRLAEERHDERMQVAGYLHDDLTQSLYRMSLQMGIVDELLRRGESRHAREELAKAEVLRDHAMNQVRAVVRDLRRSPVGREGLGQALASYAHEITADAGIKVDTRIEQLSMPPAVQLLCFQVAREAILNAVKHSGASTLRITLERTRGLAQLTVADDGKGFDGEQRSEEGHFGMMMMRERALASGGSLRIEWTPGGGTTVLATFPVAMAGPRTRG